MILGIGIDTVSIDRIKKLQQKFGKKLAIRILSPLELGKWHNLPPLKQTIALAKKFCIKEAFSKALGLGIGRGFNFNHITIENNAMGRPLFSFEEEQKRLLETILSAKFEDLNFHLSLTDESNFVNSIVIIERL